MSYTYQLTRTERTPAAIYVYAKFSNGVTEFERGYKFMLDNEPTADQITSFMAQQCLKLEAGDALTTEIEEAVSLAQGGVPAQVRMSQARIALIGAGLYDAIDGYIEALGKTHPYYQAWHFAPTIRRDATIISTLATQFNLDSAAVDALFIAAVQVEA